MGDGASSASGEGAAVIGGAGGVVWGAGVESGLFAGGCSGVAGCERAQVSMCHLRLGFPRAKSQRSDDSKDGDKAENYSSGRLLPIH